MAQDFTPRNYQVELMRIALEKNSIIFLPTGSGKTFIALMVLKGMSGSLLKPYSEGGKISMILVNTIALVEQHAKYIRDHTVLTVGQYTGDMNLDFWPKDKWYTEYNKYQVIIMTSQILVNLVNNNYIDLNKVNLLIFDECHRGVSDQPMRQLMKSFVNLTEPPRVIGLTATLLNGNCSPSKVNQEVLHLETTYHSKVVTVDGLEDVVGYSTNPTEEFKISMDYKPSYTETIVKGILEKVISLLHNIHSEPATLSVSLNGLKPITPDSGYNKLRNLVTDVMIHLSTMGTYGAVQSVIAHSIQIERIRKYCQDLNLCNALLYVLTTLQFVKELLMRSMKDVDEKDRAIKFSSDKVLKLLQIFQEYKTRSKEELCCIVFTTRRFTAKVIYYILKSLSTSHEAYSHIKPNFIVGFNSNPYTDTRENLFLSKKNRQILDSFINKEINVLVASDVLEEGVDIPKCTLVIKFDKPTNYRSYIQSKGRARHKESLYYIIIEQSELAFQSKYTEFQIVEKTLNNYLIGKNLERPEPSKHDIEKMYEEDKIKPYYVDGPGSAQVNMLSAIPLLCQYCNSLPSDIYTTYAPEWYKKQGDEDDPVSVVIVLPIVCPILERIEGPYMNNLKLAKRAAALKTCIMLHKAGELDDHLLPRRREVTEEDVSFLFTHYPSVKEKDVGFSKTKRLHKKQIPVCTQRQLTSNHVHYLHIIDLNPVFPRLESDINSSTIFDAYTSSLCFGIITANPLPVIFDFPIYVTMGTINVSLKMNFKSFVLNEKEIQDIKSFHCFIFEDLLRILQNFLIFDNNADAEMLLLVPIDKTTCKVDFDLIRSYRTIKPTQELTMDEKLSLEVSQESHLKKIISPWYRIYSCNYIVTEVSLNKNAFSTFPNEDYGSFKDYFNDKHNQSVLNPELPLLLVKGLTTRLNFIKPKSREKKRKYDKVHEEMSEYLIPELVVKQEFPSSLWIQASFLPTILYRISFCLQLEELRAKIAKDTGLGNEIVLNPIPLQLDEYLLSYVPYTGDEQTTSVVLYDFNLEDQLVSLSSSLHINKDFAAKKLEAQYPWKDIDEPKDIERELDATLMDIEYYEKFINYGVKKSGFALKNETVVMKPKQLALTYHKDFIPKSIQLLEKLSTNEGPELCVMYQALTTAKANEIVNLERLETLGDSFLKFISSVYITIRFPTYDEGRATSLKGRLVSNKNLYYLAVKRNLPGIMKYQELSPKEEWLPPGFTIPQQMQDRIKNKELSINALFNLRIPYEEQVTGVISEETLNEIRTQEYPPDSTDTSSYGSMAPFFKAQYMGDKYVADVVESLLGAYIQTAGINGGIKFVEWIGIIPKSENLAQLLASPPSNPILDKNAKPRMIDYHIPCWAQIEEVLDYKFKNRAYLLQALTHSSYSPNRITLSYEKLEFIGDAILDFLITCCIYENGRNLDPGQLTDLRSALVNNNTFASFAVRCNLHKFLLMINSQLQNHIDKFVSILEQKNFEIDDYILILLEEDEINVAEQVDVPKVLGDIFEAVAGAIYLDSGKNLKEVWRVFYKIMWKEIELFSQNVPKNIIRKLFEWPGAYPKFGKTNMTENNKTLIPLQFMRNGIPKLVHGCGSNKTMAKKAAAKLALQNLEIDT